MNTNMKFFSRECTKTTFSEVQSTFPTVQKKHILETVVPYSWEWVFALESPRAQRVLKHVNVVSVYACATPLKTELASLRGI